MQRNLTGTATFAAIKRKYTEWYGVGSGEIVDIAEPALSPDGRYIAGAGALCEKLEGVPNQRICLIDTATGAHEIVSNGPRNDRSPRFSPDGARLAYISDRTEAHNFQVQILNLADRGETDVRIADAFVEYALWSPDGKALLLGAAGTGVDLAGANGGIPSPLSDKEEAPAWAPAVDTGVKATSWRTLWRYDIATGTHTQVSPRGVNIWEAAWCGSNAIVCVASDEPGEEAWYSATLRRIDLTTGAIETLFTPADQIGWPSASPSGAGIALSEAVCSDRTLVAGVLTLIDSKGARTVDTNGVDVTFTAWQGEKHVLYGGHRAFETVLALLDVETGCSRDIWTSDSETCGAQLYPAAAPGTQPGNAAIIVEGFTTPATVTMIENGAACAVKRFVSAKSVDRAQGLGTVRPYRWKAPDGLEIHGWLATPNGPGPHPLVMEVHGGPIWLSRPTFLGRPGTSQFLLEQGYAIFRPNVRGSSGRGQDYARRVFGDMGGADTHDCLSGIDALVKEGIADPARLGVTGGSYGGFMTSWLITQDQRFAAAVSIAPITDWVSEHLTCHIPHFCQMFLKDEMTNPGGKYFSRSPIMHVKNVTTPTLNICGALDQNTPAVQALEFHHALLLNGVKSALATYPREGHGVRNFPAVIDYVQRVLSWFNEHMPSR